MKRIVSILLVFLFLVCPALASETPSPQGTVTVPIIMYHKVSKDQAQIGKFTIAPEELEADLQFLQDNGYNTVTMAQLEAFVLGTGQLPENPIVLTFDDGYYSDYRYLYPLLEQYDMQAVLSIIGKVTDEYTEENRQDIHYPHLTWFQIQEMVEAGRVEIQNHGYDLHCQRMGAQGASQRAGESDGEYAVRLTEDVTALQERAEEMLGRRPNAFTYPFGATSTISDDILHSAGFSATLICEERENLLTRGDPDCLMGLGRIIRPHGKSLEQILSA